MFRAMLLAATCFAAAAPAEVATIAVDFGEAAGTIRPLHGVNGGPSCRGETVDLSQAWREVGVPLSRLHDCDWPRPDVVDLHAVFPDPSADPADPRSYTFAKTDDYLAAVVASGSGVVYRLGESIEHTKKKYHVHPPADPARWAAACVGIVRHYNEGWAGGHRYGIRYWEVWNEPENRPACWTGTDEDYYELYEATAVALKSHDSGLAVGGPAVGSVGRFEGGGFIPTDFVAGFVRRCREKNLPLDFFSWHRYSDDPSEYVAYAQGIRAWLDEQGFQKTEIHLNEWNYLPAGDWSPLLAEGQGLPRRRWAERMQGAEGAAFAAAVLCDIQDAPIDVANFFRGDVGDFGLFDEHGTPSKVFHAFRAFRLTLETPRRVGCTGAEPGRTAAVAGVAADGSAATLLLVNSRSGTERFEVTIRGLPWSGPTAVETLLLDADHDLETVETDATLAADGRIELSVVAPAVRVVRLKPVAAD